MADRMSEFLPDRMWQFLPEKKNRILYQIECQNWCQVVKIYLRYNVTICGHAHIFWHFICQNFWQSICHKFWYIFSHRFWPSIFGKNFDLLSTRFWQCIWHNRTRALAVDIQCKTLPSGSCWGLAGNNAIESLRLRSGREYCVGTTAIANSPLMSGGEHCRLELVVDVRVGTLPSGAYGWGRVGTLPWGTRTWGPGTEHCGRELAVEVRRGTLPSRASNWGPMWNTAIGSRQNVEEMEEEAEKWLT